MLGLINPLKPKEKVKQNCVMSSWFFDLFVVKVVQKSVNNMETVFVASLDKF